MGPTNIGALAGKLYDLLLDLEPGDRAKVVGATMMLFGEAVPTKSLGSNGQSVKRAVSSQPKFSEREDVSAKQFLAEKQPQTDIERITCLAFYLAHFRDMPYFKTIDISKLNTEAAQIKLSNVAQAMINASTRGFITSATKGAKQMSVFGEEYVSSLPNRDAAKIVMQKRRRPRKKTKKAKMTE